MHLLQTSSIMNTPRLLGHRSLHFSAFLPSACMRIEGVLSLGLPQPRDCIQVAIVNDIIADPDEVFEVVLTTNTVNAIVLDGGDTATVTITDDDIGLSMPKPACSYSFCK